MMELSEEKLQELLTHAAEEGAKKALKKQYEGWLTEDEVIKELGVSRTTIWRYEKKGLLQTNDRIGNQKKYSANSVKTIKQRIHDIFEKR
jgi:DNA-directed RNA polymerase specialized sigma subunit